MTIKLTFENSASNLQKLDAIRGEHDCVYKVDYEGNSISITYSNYGIMGGTTGQLFEKAFGNAHGDSRPNRYGWIPKL